MTIQEALRLKVVAVEGFIWDDSTKTWYMDQIHLLLVDQHPANMNALMKKLRNAWMTK